MRRCGSDGECTCFDYSSKKGSQCRQYHGSAELAASSDGYDAYTRSPPTPEFKRGTKFVEVPQAGPQE